MLILFNKILYNYGVYMKKKHLSRLKKSSLLLFLICFLTFNNYGAVSISDGSLFVSKAEMSADLNSISNRIALIESSLDSKIDSLVSMYLNKNGIWNGESQKIFNTDNIVWQYGFKSGNSYTARYHINWNAESGSTVGGIGLSQEIARREIITYDNKLDKKIVDNITKSGLLVIKSKSSDLTSADPRCYVASCNRSTVTSFAADHFMFLYNASIDFYQESSKLLSTISTEYTGQQGGTYLLCPEIPSGLVIMFVTKNKPLYVSYKNSVTKDAGTQWANTLAWVNTNANGAYTYRKWSIEDIKVY